MFLNVAYRDFEDAASSEDIDLVDLGLITVHDMQRTRDPFCQPPGLCTPSSLPTGLPALKISSKEARLWDYFVNFITPQCAVRLAANPYRSVVLRIAAAAPGGPLFQCVMAIAASQMYNLRHGEPGTSTWEFRALALKSLRSHLDANQHGPEEAIVTIVMMSFLEILEDCSPSWIVHADFGERLLASHTTLMVTNPDLYHFLATWLIVHNVLASTAWGKSGSVKTTALLDSVNEDYVQTLTGCSKSMLCLLADITALADPDSSRSPAPGGDKIPACERTKGIDARAAAKRERDGMERQLCHVYPVSIADSTVGNEIRAISELKRLATLMYLYARIDDSSPYEPHMARLTEEILEVLPGIPLRTNTVLWPLFILGTLGVRPESDDHRKIVLQMLDSLQKTRQLGCVKKARQIIGDVWKARDLRTADAIKGWAILEGRHRNISLA
ncbi:hypothetical protein VP1G_02690 [Cytospora mali]|uniref:Fungal-specific transcription factor domain-containing protein n=1 Tax=Cytospora mali TaxID=578113 RepID=A0A194UUD3_CYTMA|nr:hypothetical protein VP1G_02690 [Valsa mali var. pyri (nom. inval.)]